MKITYRIDKKGMQKDPDLRGVLRASENRPANQIVKPTSHIVKKQSNTRWGRSFFTGVLGFALLVIILYFARVPFVVSTVEILTNDQSSVSKATYTTIPMSFAATVSTSLQDVIKTKLSGVGTDATKRFSFEDTSTAVSIEVASSIPTGATALYTSYLVPVGHMYWIRDTVSKAQLQKDTIYVAQGKKAMYAPLIKEYLGGTEPNITETSDLANTLKKQELSVGFVEANDLSGMYKVLSLEGHFFLDKDVKGGIPYSAILTGNSEQAKAIVLARTQAILPLSFDASQIGIVDITGTTAISRGIGSKTQKSGDPGYPAQRIASFFKGADIVTTSNEVSFSPGCNPGSNIMTFCTDPAAIKALKDIGANVIQLTGNHNNDYGFTANTNSINTYKKLGWDYFGGGLNASDAAKILYKDVKGTKIAFLGYNYYDTQQHTSEIATNSHPGANSWSPTKIKNDVATAKANGANFVIVYFTYQECWAYPDSGYVNVGYPACYTPQTAPNQKKDFRQAVDAGADMVVQPNDPQPMTYEIYKGKPIFYSLGNLFFDQVQWMGTRQGLILTNYYYKGSYLTTKVTTTLFDNDLRVYVTTGQQRTTLLTALKKARNF